jgi:hypothetical protein
MLPPTRNRKRKEGVTDEEDDAEADELAADPVDERVAAEQPARKMRATVMVFLSYLLWMSKLVFMFANRLPRNV